MHKERVIVVAPGRASYIRDSSNYLKNSSEKKFINLINDINKKRDINKEINILDLDRSSFRTKLHMIGKNAGPLTYACSLSDYFCIDKDRYEIVAILGNSMGWYSALALSGSISFIDGNDLIYNMSALMDENTIGGQIIYPIVDDNWYFDKSEYNDLIKKIQTESVYISILLGGYIVIGGNVDALKNLMLKLKPKGDYPFQIPYHSAFHTPLLNEITYLAKDKNNIEIFDKPKIPIIDGMGKIWTNFSTNINKLYDYTFGYQIVNPYDYTKAITVAIKEFAPDKIILLGPGNSLGAPTAQILIKENWLEMDSKESFQAIQDEKNYIISMSRKDQRLQVCK